MEFTRIWTERDTKETGKPISKTVKEKKNGLMEQLMKVITNWAKNTGMASLSGLMDHTMMESFLATTSKESAFTSGQMEENIKVNGKITRWKAKECFHGLIKGSMKESIWMIRRKVSALFIGLTAENTLVSGQTESNTAEAHSLLKTANRGKGSGIMGRD